MRYWERLNHFQMFSNERRMERYRIMYLWKSVNGIVPSLGVERMMKDPSKLTYPRVHGRGGFVRTLQRFSITWDGVRLYNSLPRRLREWKGSKETFKTILDKFLDGIPNQPELPDRKPGGRTLDNKPSNSIPDWVRTLNLSDDVLDDEEGDDDLVVNINVNDIPDSLPISTSKDSTDALGAEAKP